MALRPTPIADELLSIGASFEARAKADQPLAGAELLQSAEQLHALASAAGPVERFYAELVAEAEEQELVQTEGQCGKQAC